MVLVWTKRSQADGWPTTVLKKTLCKKALFYYKGGSLGAGFLGFSRLVGFVP